MQDRVKEQYEALPYPARGLLEAVGELPIASPSTFQEVNHFVEGGRWDPKKPRRILVAGGGSGIGLTQIAEEMRLVNCPAEITYLDLSSASAQLAEQHIHARGFGDEIRFNVGRIEEFQADQKFDYIDCAFVLHHLPDPDLGLRQLANLLTPTGGIGIAVYAPYGRSGIYPFQDLMQHLAPDAPVAERLDLGRRLHRQLNEAHILKRNPLFALEAPDDSEFYDRYLHTQDRAYTVAQLGPWLAQAGLRRTGFSLPLAYMPETYISDPELQTLFRTLPQEHREILAELLSGWPRSHIFYAVHQDNPVTSPSPSDLSVVPTLRLRFDKQATLRDGKILCNLTGIQQSTLSLPPTALRILEQIDESRSLDEIRTSLSPQPDPQQFLQEFAPLHVALHGSGQMFYRYRRSNSL